MKNKIIFVLATGLLLGCQPGGNFSLREKGDQSDNQTMTPPLPAPGPSSTLTQNQKIAGVSVGKDDEDDVQEEGMLIPTIYYTPLIEEGPQTCPGDEKVPLLNSRNETLITVCPKTEAACALQGTCYITQNGRMRRFNLSGSFEADSKGSHHFMEMINSECRFGLGVQDICLDPFYSVAADLSHYHPGDVIYIPDVKGVMLPDGTRHSGYFVVRDDGPRITGKGRFDFYTGFLNWTSPLNPLAKKKLADPATRMPYAVVTGPRAEEARRERNFPK